MKHWHILFTLGAMAALLVGPLGAQDKAKPGRDAPLPAPVAARQALSVVLGRPTDHSVTLNLRSEKDRSVTVTCTSEPPGPGKSVGPIALPAGTNTEVLVDGLAPDREYRYRLSDGPEGRFHTQRAPGSPFVFEVIGDSHPERPQQFDPALYDRTLTAAAADKPDFFLTIGDDFSVDTLPKITPEAVESIFLRQRLYLSSVGSVSPLFLVNGNHEQASRANLDGTSENVAVWSQTRRNSFFSLPGPDGFYTGDGEVVPPIGLLRDYYAWTWGDALLVVIDPYWHSAVPVDNALGGRDKSQRDLWQVTLGEAQYRWLEKTLSESPAKFKFVFSHHVLGTGRGGIEEAGLYEWGGKNPKGQDEFAARRPGWALPIHPLFVKTRVTAFVQGHDHIFANQLLDGVTYLTLPEPADPTGTLYNKDAFKTGDTAANTGRVRFTVGPQKVVIEYLKQKVEPAYRFEIPAGGPPAPGVFDVSQVTPTAPAANESSKGKKKP